jgi:hypothetical protein
MSAFAFVCLNCGWEHDGIHSANKCCPSPRVSQVEDIERNASGAIIDCAEVARAPKRK